MNIYILISHLTLKSASWSVSCCSYMIVMWIFHAEDRWITQQSQKIFLKARKPFLKELIFLRIGIDRDPLVWTILLVSGGNCTVVLIPGNPRVANVWGRKNHSTCWGSPWHPRRTPRSYRGSSLSTTKCPSRDQLDLKPFFAGYQLQF